jgi:hypothetical protein
MLYIYEINKNNKNKTKIYETVENKPSQIKQNNKRIYVGQLQGD